MRIFLISFFNKKKILGSRRNFCNKIQKASRDHQKHDMYEKNKTEYSSFATKL